MVMANPRTKNEKFCTGTASAPRRKSTRKPAQPRRNGCSKSVQPAGRKTSTPRTGVLARLGSFLSASLGRLNKPAIRKWGNRVLIGIAGGTFGAAALIGTLYAVMSVAGAAIGGPVFLGMVIAHFGVLAVRWWEAR